MYLSIGQAAEILGVSISTLRRWEKESYFIPEFSTKGQHRRYSLAKLETFFGLESAPSPNVHALAYARVFSHDQRNDLETQCLKLENYCQANFSSYQVLSDLGSGLNFKKAGFKKLLNLILKRKISHLVLNYKDRLLRFGSELVFDLCAHFGVNVIILEQCERPSFEEELARDVIELMTVFSVRLYGRRSHQNRRKVAA